MTANLNQSALSTCEPGYSQETTDFLKHWRLWYDYFGKSDAEEGLLDQACEWHGKDILDVGTGNGRLTFKLATKCKSITGIDIDERLIHAANVEAIKLNQVNTKFLTMNAHALQFGDATFDLVIFPWTLHAMQNQVQALAEARRVLRPGGKVVIFGILSDAEYNKVVEPFLAEAPKPIEPRTYYEEPLKDFGEIQSIAYPSREQSPVFDFPSFNVAQEAFLFGLTYWHDIPITPDVEQKLVAILKTYGQGNSYQLFVDCGLYVAQKPIEQRT